MRTNLKGGKEMMREKPLGERHNEELRNRIADEAAYWESLMRDVEYGRCPHLVAEGCFPCPYGTKKRGYCSLVKEVNDVEEYPEEFWCDQVMRELSKREDELAFL